MREEKRNHPVGRFDFYSKQTVAIIIVFLFFVILNGCPTSGITHEYTGEFLVNDSGVSHGGFEWASLYTASLTIRGTRGNLTLTQSIGLGDYLTKHKLSIRDFADFGGNISFKIEGRAAALVLVEEDTIWNRKYDNYLTGNKTSDPAEQIGSLPIEPFVGFNPRYYIDLRLQPDRPELALFNLVKKIR